MNSQWRDDSPIYKQLAEKIRKGILDRVYAEGHALPSVRAVSAELNINHLTVAKSYHELVDEGLLDKRRGLGMFVKAGALESLTLLEKESFMQQELPELVERMKQLEISASTVISFIQTNIKDNES